ncbi:disintegrin and metalloproteinase domain-containing protein 10-like [Mytilus galloprovincialis]|uniref:disintegrin and metalloproteinase domain-containing protein 10-like n=1 Tax=Mytilus galloprovincialis TaxID=29158 RepID=UPI003F7B6DAD
MKYPCIDLFLQSIYLICNIDAKSLDRFIKQYEELHYSTNDLQSSHLRSKQSLTNEPFQFGFNAFQRNFIIVLQQDKSVFNKDAALDTSVPLDTSHIYVGHVKGCKGSRVFGYIVDGYFHGSIKILQETTYHIEPTKRFIGKVKEVPKAHSVIYKEDDIVSDLHRLQKESDNKVVSSWQNKVHQWMQKEAKSGHTDRDERYDYNRESKYTQLNHSNRILDRHKRRGILGDKNACFLYMQADPMLFNRINSAYHNEVLAKQYILGLFATHVDAINTIYSNMVFKTYDNSINYSGVRFKIQRVQIMTDATEKCSTNQASKFCENNTDVVNFLNLHSQSDHSAFCLAYTFTYRDFLHGSLGLAWMAYTGQTSGGICEKYKSFSGNGLPVMKSLNTGVVTLLNYGEDVPPRLSHLSFAHQVGHSFGSPHDNGQLCAPYGTAAVDAEDGKYIMNDGSTNGKMQHNDEFSPCSKDNITRVMDAVFKGRYGKVNCFQNDNTAFCGNNIVEDGEECDCGYDEDCTDQCCVGRQSDGSGCVLMAGKQCSPSQGSCCDPETCRPVTDGRQCIPETDCAAASYCTYLFNIGPLCLSMV